MKLHNVIIIEENFEVTSLHDEYLKDVREKMQGLKGRGNVNADGGIEIYTDYRERELSNGTLKKIMDSDDPRREFEEMLAEWESNYALDYRWDELVNDVKAELNDAELKFWEDNEEECQELLREEFYYYYDKNDFNNEVNVNIMVDCGNANADFTDDNFGYYGHRGCVPKNSSLLWLANQQGKGEEFKAAVKEWYNGTAEYMDRDKFNDPFIESMIQEVENIQTSIGTLTFLVKMPLLKLFDCLDLQTKEKDERFRYEPQKNEASKSYIVLGKKTMCGLYNSWDGSGSIFEIKLDKDVELPIKYCRFAVDGCHTWGYDVKEVYGFIGSCWKDSLKEIKEVG